MINHYKNTIFNLEDNNIFIIGGAGQIGLRSCEILYDAGANIFVVDAVSEAVFRNERNAARISISKLKNFKYFQIDITDENQVQNLVEEFSSDIDVVINHAHFKGDPAHLVPFSPFFAQIEDYNTKFWSDTINTNLDGLFITTKHFGNKMIKQKHGVFVNTSSTYGLVSPNHNIYGNSGINSPISYATTKAAILNFTRYIATHWAKHDIRANCLSPGGVHNDGQSKEFQQKYKQQVPINRLANDTDYQGAILFLSSPASSYMTGANLIVDGGWTAW